MGPTGAGKSKLARRIFELKKVRHAVKGDFIDVNCATLRGDAAMSALFGHVKGAFTGALKDRPGLLRALTKVFCFWMKSASWVWMNRQCCCGRSKRKRFCRSGQTMKRTATSNSLPEPTATYIKPFTNGDFVKICWLESTFGHFACRV